MNTTENNAHQDDAHSWDCSINNSVTHTDLQKRTVTQAAQLRAKNELIDNMIYQIRTLSNAVIGFSDLLSTEPLSSDQAEYVQEIHCAGQGLSVLVNDVLDWAQLLSDNLRINQTRFYVSDIIRTIEKVLLRASNEKNLNTQIVTDPEMPACICSDEERLLKCLLNLVASAIRYTPQGNIRFQVCSEQNEDKTFICFDVISSGAEIGAEELNRIFEPTDYQIEMDKESFSQLSQGLTVTAGLPLTKLLCEALGGTIEVTRQSDEGSIFSLRIPAGVTSATEPVLGDVSWEYEIEEVPLETQTQGTVLLVEDQQSNRTVISLMLENLGVRVDTAQDGEEAILKVNENTYDLILMDIKMPRMDGYEATRQLRAKGIEAPIVALSAKVFNENEHHLISTMFDGFLTKPVDSRKLSETIRKFIKTVSDPEDQTSQEEMIVIKYQN